jgi:hypothetical protein
MAKGRILDLINPAHIMQQAGGNQNVIVNGFGFGNLQGIVQYPIHMLAVMGAVVHTRAHIVFDL